MKDGRHWPLIIIGMIVGNFLAVGTLIYLSGSDPSHQVVEDDYYQRAVTHDDTMAQQRENLRIGWKATVVLSATGASGDAAVSVRLTDRDGAAVTGAAIALTTYHRARAGQRVRLELHEGAPGTYRVGMPSRRWGLWNVALTATRGALTYTHQTTAELRDPSSPAAEGAGQVEGERR